MATISRYVEAVLVAGMLLPPGCCQDPGFSDREGSAGSSTDQERGGCGAGLGWVVGSTRSLDCSGVATLDAQDQSAAIAGVLLSPSRALAVVHPASGSGGMNAWMLGGDGYRRIDLPVGGVVTAASNVALDEVALAVESAEQGINTLDIVRYDVSRHEMLGAVRFVDEEQEPIYRQDGNRLVETMTPSSRIWRNGLDVPHVRLLQMAGGDLLLSLAADQSLKLVRYSRDGVRIAKKVLLPSVPWRIRNFVTGALLARSGDRLYAVFPVAAEDERLALAFHGLSEDDGRGYGGYLVVEMTASWERTSGVYVPSPSDARLTPTAVEPRGEALYVAGLIERSASEHQPYIARFSRPAPGQPLSLAFSEELSQVEMSSTVSSLQVIGGDRLVIGGMEGFQQANSGSVLTDGRAYVALYREGAGISDKLSWGGEGRNFVVAMDASFPCIISVMSTERQLLTHEAPTARSPITVLSQIEIGGCLR